MAILLGIEEVDKLDRKLKTLNVSGLDDLKIEYVHMFTSPHITQSDSFLDTVRDIGSWPQVISTTMCVQKYVLSYLNIFIVIKYFQDPLEYVLLCSVLLFCPDLLQLAQNSQIQKTQTKFAVLLYKYLNKKYDWVTKYKNILLMMKNISGTRTSPAWRCPGTRAASTS